MTKLYYWLFVFCLRRLVRHGEIKHDNVFEFIAKCLLILQDTLGIDVFNNKLIPPVGPIPKEENDTVIQIPKSELMIFNRKDKEGFFHV